MPISIESTHRRHSAHKAPVALVATAMALALLGAVSVINPVCAAPGVSENTLPNANRTVRDVAARNPDLRRMASKYDPVSNHYLIYRPNLPFVPFEHSTVSSWEHFDAWLADAQGHPIEHVQLPPGPWVTNARLDGLFLRAFRNFSCGTDCYRHYDLSLCSGVIQVTITGRPSAISPSVTGTYQLSPDRKHWEKLRGLPG